MEAIDTLNREVPCLSIIGTGLIGGSVGLGLRAYGFQGRVIGVGRRPSTLARARKRGCIDEVTDDLVAAVAKSRVVILATPVGSFAGLLERIALHDHEELVITDVGSTKVEVCSDARRLLPTPQRFVGSHPMAGSEQDGPEAADATLFRNKPCILTPEADTDPRALAIVELLWTCLKMRVLRMAAEEHDRKTAVISHLPHAAAVLLTQVAGRLGGFEIASTGLRDTTRLASSHPQMRADIMLGNRQPLIEALDTFSEELAGLRRLLSAADAESLIEFLKRTKRLRDEWIKP